MVESCVTHSAVAGVDVVAGVGGSGGIVSDAEAGGVAASGVAAGGVGGIGGTGGGGAASGGDADGGVASEIRRG